MKKYVTKTEANDVMTLLYKKFGHFVASPVITAVAGAIMTCANFLEGILIK